MNAQVPVGVFRTGVLGADQFASYGMGYLNLPKTRDFSGGLVIASGLSVNHAQQISLVVVPKPTDSAVYIGQVLTYLTL